MINHYKNKLYFTRISNEMVKEGGAILTNFLMVFLNKILLEGEVPGGLNSGRCLLIYKVIMHPDCSSHRK